MGPYPQHGGRILCSAYVHGITQLAHQQQAGEEERGQHLEKQPTSAAGFLDVLAQGGRPTNVQDVKCFLCRMDRSARGEDDD
jgi:hypothetical protein